MMEWGDLEVEAFYVPSEMSYFFLLNYIFLVRWDVLLWMYFTGDWIIFFKDVYSTMTIKRQSLYLYVSQLKGQPPESLY